MTSSVGKLLLVSMLVLPQQGGFEGFRRADSETRCTGCADAPGRTCCPADLYIGCNKRNNGCECTCFRVRGMTAEEISAEIVAKTLGVEASVASRIAAKERLKLVENAFAATALGKTYNVQTQNEQWQVTLVIPEAEKQRLQGKGFFAVPQKTHPKR